MGLLNLSSVTPLQCVNGSPVWTERDTEILTVLFPFTSNRLLSEAFGVSKYQIIMKALDLNLQKDPTAMVKHYEDEIIRLYQNLSTREIADMLNVSLSFVKGICRANHLTKTQEAVSDIKRRKRKNLLKRERARVVWGFPALSNLPVFSHRQKSKVRHGLRQAGYIVRRSESVVFYDSNTNRSARREAFAEKLGFKFLPVDSDINEYDL